jgi:alpha-L-rhamnosidase
VRVCDAVIAQAWTEYDKTITYDTYDVTTKMHRGENVIGVLLGNGMYNVQQTRGRYTKFERSYGAPKMIAELRVRYSDGKSETIATDGQWQVAPGPIRFSSTYGGEDFDARAALKGWGSCGCGYFGVECGAGDTGAGWKTGRGNCAADGRARALHRTHG